MNVITRFLVIALTFITSVLSAQNYNQQLEKIIANYYIANKVTPYAFLSEDQTIRKIYLTLAGRIPTEEEILDFKRSSNPAKKALVIRKIINSEDFVSNYYNYWSDLLRPRERLNQTNYVSGLNYISWLKESFRNNIPYDKWVKSLLLADGNYFDNGATGYFLRDQGMKEDNLIGTMKIFAGVDVGCAQCHDDPFQSWTQYQFHESLAYFYKNTLREEDKEKSKKIKAIREDLDKIVNQQNETGEKVKKRNVANQASQFLQASLVGVYTQDNMEVKLPDNYKYSNAKPKDVVKPKVLFDKERSTDSDRRKQFTDWLVTPEHPTFTKNIVNHLWKFVYGYPLISDMYRVNEKEEINRELMDSLCKTFISMKYDTKKFVELLCNLSLYHRYNYDGPKHEWKLQGPVRRRLSAEQIWDSVLTATLPNVNYVHLDAYKDDYNKMFKWANFSSLTSDDVLERIKEYQGLNASKKAGVKTFKGYNLIRSSEINDENQAAAHLLIHMGRSERELIGNSSRDGSVTQVILFVNGILPEIVTQKDSILMQKLKNKSKADQLTIIFRSLLSRAPTITERGFYEKYEVEDIIWACLNSHEFKFAGA